MKKLYLLPLLAAMASQGCQQTATTTAAKDTTIVTRPDSAGRQEFPLPPTTEEMVRRLRAETDSIRNLLKSSTPEQAAGIYTRFSDDVYERLINVIQTNESRWIEDYINFFNEESDIPHPDKATQKRIDLLATAGIEPNYIGEGYTELRLKPDFYQQLFGPYLPADYKAYIDLSARHDSTLFDADAGVIVPWSEVARRTEEWERYLAAYDTSPLRQAAGDLYTYYMRVFLMGEDNTPTVDNNTFMPDVREAMVAYVERNPNSQGGKLVAAFLEKAGHKPDRLELEKWVGDHLSVSK